MLHELAAANSPGFLATVFFLGFFTVSFFIGPVVGVAMIGHQQQLKEAAKRRTFVAEMIAEIRTHLQQAAALEKQAIAEVGPDQPEELKKQAEQHRLMARQRLTEALGAAKHNVRKKTRSRDDEAQLLELIKLQTDHFGAEKAPE
jgi:hypothetical protein